VDERNEEIDDLYNTSTLHVQYLGDYAFTL